MARRDEEKKRRRQKRLEKRQGRSQDRAPEAPWLKALAQAARVPAPARWPGASDPSVQRPDLLKAELAGFAT